MLATPGATASASSQRHLQGLMTRRTVTAEPKNAAQYFGHIASLVQVNEDLTKLRTYNLKRRAKIAYKGYEAVLSRKKRAVSGSSIKASPGNMLYVSRPGAIPSPTTATFNPAAVLQLQAMLPRAQPVAVKPAPKIAASVSSVVPSTAVATSTATSSVASGRMTPAQMQLHQQQMKSAQLQQQPKRSDFVVGSTVLIRNTADLIACGARNLAGKSGRIVAAPQIYGQELFSVYIDEHEALFQVPFNALTLVARPTPTQQQQTQAQMQQMQAQLSVPRQNENGQASKGSKSSEQIKMEHSFQLHRLMQQQYREIQVLQQRYAECRLVNPTALSGIQKELSKLRLAHLSQVQSLKSKQALDFDWQVGSK